MSDLIQVGIISSTHGIRGEVKVFPTTDKVERFKQLKHIILDTGKQEEVLEIEQVKFFKQFAILKFKGIDNINDIEKYKGKSLFVTKENAVKCEKDEYFISDIIGILVINDQGEELGILEEVLETGANDVYVVKTKSGSELLLPAIKQCIQKIDIEAQCMTVHLLEGL